MCLVCREMLPKAELIRIVKKPDGNYVTDITGKANGRGAYICKKEDCIKKCKAKRVLNKSFKTQVPEEVYDSLSAVLPKA